MNLITKHIKSLTLALSLLLALNSFSQALQKTRILFVLDASQSMYGLWGQEQKMRVASRLLSNLMDSLQHVENLEVALRVYGHQFSVAAGNRSCEDTKLEVPFGGKNYSKIKTKLMEIRPTGTTPIAYSLEQTKNDFPPCANCRNIIILITDGIEECQGDPCAVALALQKNGVLLRPFVIGMGLDLETIEAFRCVGNFFETKDAASFQNVLQVVISQAMNNTSVQINLIDGFGQPSETDVNMTFYDSFSKSIQYNYIHTMNYYGVPDTVPINPAMKYDLTVHTLPEVTKKDITINPGKHNVIAVDAPQGMLKLEMSGMNEYSDLKCLVRKHGDLNTFHVQNFEEVTKYIVGDYDLEILTLPRIKVNKVNIAQSHTTKVFIADPGLATIFLPAKGIASVFVQENNTLKWIYNLSPNSTRETVILQPGNYVLVYRSVNSKKVIETKEKSFKITSGVSTQLKF
ncbi:MAG: VWA domain-containing protein [Flavobacteriales bacterium]|nr:VWA domain-containing protein [Flavobacteriales bacterium]